MKKKNMTSIVGVLSPFFIASLLSVALGHAQDTHKITNREELTPTLVDTEENNRSVSASLEVEGPTNGQEAQSSVGPTQLDSNNPTTEEIGESIIKGSQNEAQQIVFEDPDSNEFFYVDIFKDDLPTEVLTENNKQSEESSPKAEVIESKIITTIPQGPLQKQEPQSYSALDPKPMALINEFVADNEKISETPLEKVSEPSQLILSNNEQNLFDIDPKKGNIFSSNYDTLSLFPNGDELTNQDLFSNESSLFSLEQQDDDIADNIIAVNTHEFDTSEQEILNEVTIIDDSFSELDETRDLSSKEDSSQISDVNELVTRLDQTKKQIGELEDQVSSEVSETDRDGIIITISELKEKLTQVEEDSKTIDPNTNKEQLITSIEGLKQQLDEIRSLFSTQKSEPKIKEEEKIAEESSYENQLEEEIASLEKKNQSLVGLNDKLNSAYCSVRSELSQLSVNFKNFQRQQEQVMANPYMAMMNNPFMMGLMMGKNYQTPRYDAFNGQEARRFFGRNYTSLEDRLGLNRFSMSDMLGIAPTINNTYIFGNEENNSRNFLGDYFSGNHMYRNFAQKSNFPGIEQNTRALHNPFSYDFTSGVLNKSMFEQMNALNSPNFQSQIKRLPTASFSPLPTVDNIVENAQEIRSTASSVTPGIGSQSQQLSID